MIEYLVFVILTDEPLLNIMPVSSFVTVICDVFVCFSFQFYLDVDFVSGKNVHGHFLSGIYSDPSICVIGSNIHILVILW